MDKLELVVRKSVEEDYDVVDIIINDRNLSDLLREIELPYALSESDEAECIAGNYEGLLPENIFSPSKHLWGESVFEYKYVEGKITLLDCPCGIPGCWPFQVKITIMKDKIVWSDFEQPHRSLDNWTYSEMQPFIFDKEQYEKEWKKIYFETEKNST